VSGLTPTPVKTPIYKLPLLLIKKSSTKIKTVIGDLFKTLKILKIKVIEFKLK